MSLITDSSRVRPQPETEPPVRGGGRRAIWIRVGLALALVAVSGVLRGWQQTRVDAALRSGKVSPFPLADLPMTLGPWEGRDDDLDPIIAKRTGAADAIFRTYVNRLTGVRLSLILLYGPAADVYVHSPENCYPASGYTMAGNPRFREVEVSGDEGEKVPFQATTFARGEGGRLQRQQVYCTWRFGGRWAPVLPTHKQTERVPGMFKVHIDRPTAPQELLAGEGGAVDPCEDFLSLLMSELDHRLAVADRR